MKTRIVRSLASTAVVLAALTAGMVVLPTAAHADPQACDVRANTPSSAYDTVKGSGRILSGCGSGWTINVQVQRSRWYGWETRASARITRAGYDQFVYYNCNNTGTYDYRIRVYGERNNPWGVETKTSSAIREIVC